MVRASIDIGSNSTLLLIAKVEGSKVETLVSESRVTGLGRDIDKNNKFLEVAMNETQSALAEYVSIATTFNIKASEILITATEASRVATNAHQFFVSLKDSLGIEVSVITGEAEAYFSTKGILLNQNLEKDITIMDIGGASTELINVSASGEIKKSISMPIGSVRLSSWINSDKFDDEKSKFLKKYKNEILLYRNKSIVCVAGTMTSLANMYLEHDTFVESNIHNQKLTYVDLKEKLNHTLDLDNRVILEKYSFLGKRHATIKGGIKAAFMMLELLDVEDVVISTYGLRYGTILEGEIQSGFIFRRD